MTKTELKSALNLAGIEHKAKANLETLQALFDQAVAEQILNEDGTLFQKGPEGDDAVPPANLVPADDFTMSDEELAGQQGRPTADPRDGDCPGCGIHLSNGLLTRDDEVANKPGITLHMEGMTKEFHCMGCGHEWGDEVAPYVAPAKPEPTGNGLKIEKDRPEQNGIKRPSIGGKCRAIWDALDEYRAETGELPTSKTVKELAADSGWNPNNASIEFYQWRKYHGIGKQA